MGSLWQVTIALLYLWNVSVIKCAPTRTDVAPFHFTNGGSLGLDNGNALPDQFPRNSNYWSKESGSSGENGESSKQDEFILPTIYQMRRQWEHNAVAQDNDYLASSAATDDEGGGVNDDSNELGSKPAAASGEEYDSRNRNPDEPRPKALRYNFFRNFVYPDEREAIEAQYGAPNGVAEYYKTAAKRSPMCLRKCMAQGLLHPAQCHSLC